MVGFSRPRIEYGAGSVGWCMDAGCCREVRCKAIKVRLAWLIERNGSMAALLSRDPNVISKSLGLRSGPAFV